MALVHPDYWHYSIMSDDVAQCLKVIQTFRLTTSYYVNARTHHIDGILKGAAADGIAQVVNLGAGYDSRAYRFRKRLPQVRFFEIELPEMIAEKKRRLKRVLGEVPDYVAFVPVDFNTQTIPGELQKAGYDPTLKTLFIWEGVTMYISAEAVDNTLEFIRTRSAPGSSVVFDYMPLAVIRGDFSKHGDIRGLAFWVAHKGEPFTFGVAEGQSAEFVERRGLTVLSDIGPKELEKRYLTRSDGKLEGPCASAFRIMHARVPAR
jgi:methyltransferase (TIGR00027 family)